MRDAGYNFIIKSNIHGFTFKINGFNDKIDIIYDKLIKDFHTLISQIDFNIYTAMLKIYKGKISNQINVANDKPYKTILRINTLKYIYMNIYDYEYINNILNDKDKDNNKLIEDDKLS